jgi:hypothetical protein
MSIILSDAKRRNVLGVSHLISIYFVVFLARSLYDLTFSADVNYIQKVCVCVCVCMYVCMCVCVWALLRYPSLPPPSSPLQELNKLQNPHDIQKYYISLLVFDLIFEVSRRPHTLTLAHTHSHTLTLSHTRRFSQLCFCCGRC